MKLSSRREFLGRIGVAGMGSVLSGLAWPFNAIAQSSGAKGHVVVIGGGFGGATCAKYIHKFDPAIKVTLVERDARFVTCPFSNAVLGGMYDMGKITHDYKRLRDKYEINVIHANVVGIDADGKEVTLDNGKKLAYDRLVISPGIDFKWGSVEGYDKAAGQKMPHAWKGGPQTLILHKQLKSMKNGGLVIIAPPDNPFRCPPGPYERASMIANYLKHNKPKSKILILDAKDKFSKQPLFMQGWKKLYPGMIEWVKGSEGGRVDRVEANKLLVYSELGARHRGDVVNLIPPQQAGAIAHKAGLVNNDGWCQVDQRTFESRVHKHIYVIGDASVAGKMPKSGFAANSQGKVCAAAIVSALNDFQMPEPSYVNTCYSLISPDYGISVAAVYRVTENGIVPVKGAGGVSPQGVDAEFRKKEAEYAVGWYESITSDIFS